MKTLIDIIPDSIKSQVTGDMEIEVKGMSLDSRKIQKGFLFAAIKGYTVDGHDFISNAIDNGATSIFCEDLPKDIVEGVTYVNVEKSAESLGVVAAAFYDYPSRGFELIGITGTNGKTTVGTLLYKLFSEMGYRTGLISTVENIIVGKTIPANLTTPDVITLNALMQEMNEANCDYVFMEVSSHAVHQKRIAGLEFRGGVFTNISHDHLDYHKTFKAYIEAKKKFFDEMKPEAFALVNIDDRNGEVMIQNTKAMKKRYSLRKIADYKSKVLDNSIDGLQLEMNDIDVHLKLIGNFNAYNATAVFGVAIELGLDKFKVLQILSSLKSAEGRFDLLKSQTSNVSAIVDYAHTPDALEKVLDTIQALKRKDTRVITVVGCGGNRDKKKRPEMARVASEKSDQIVITSDNPRDENPEDILNDMLPGIPPGRKMKMLRISERRSAIIAALSMAKDNDIVLIAGKGHEKYQEIMGKKFPFDDKKIVQEFLH